MENLRGFESSIIYWAVASFPVVLRVHFVRFTLPSSLYFKLKKRCSLEHGLAPQLFFVFETKELQSLNDVLYS